jgi:hypothetical protein
MTAADSLQASIPLTYYTQTMRTVAMAPLHNVAAPGNLRDLYSVPVVPQLPP